MALIDPYEQNTGELIDPFETQAAPPQPEGKGFFTRVGDDISKRWQNIKNIDAPTTGLASLWATGEVAGLGSDIIGQGLKSVYRTLTPQATQDMFAEGAKNVAEYYAKPISAVAEGYNELKSKYPNLVRSGEAVANIGQFVPMAKGTQLVGKEALNVARDVASVVPKPNLSIIPKTTKGILGTTTGAGPSAIEEAIKGTDDFVRAMRGQISSDEIVGNAKAALNVIKDNRSAAYQKELATISQSKKILDKSPIDNHLSSLMDKYNARILSDGTIDTSKIAMGKSGRNDIKEIIDTVRNWDDTSPLGLDALKRQLADFYSDSSQARQFVASIEKNVADTIKKNVPEYANMTKGYAEATSLIKDIESGLMMRKQGMSGHITSDQTLRRLTSAMRENFELRKELVDALSMEGGQDIAGQVAGYAMSQGYPRGFIGKLAAGGTGLIAYGINPKMWPLLAASSPRVVGEFLNIYGKAKRAIAGESIPGMKSAIGRKVESMLPDNPLTDITRVDSFLDNKTIRGANNIIKKKLID